MTKSDRIISWLTGLTTLAMTALSFILSFNALTDLAGQYGVSIPPFIPLIIEGSVIVFSLNTLYRSLHGIPAWWQWSLIIGSSLLAGVFNIIHAPASTPAIVMPILNISVNPARVMAALPSVFLLASFETFLSQLKHAVKFDNTSVTLAQLEVKLRSRQAEVDQVLNDLNSQIEQRQAEISAQVNEAQKQTEQLLGDLNSRFEQRQEELNGVLAMLDAQVTQRKSEINALCSEIERLNSLERAQAERLQQADANTIERRRLLVSILEAEGDIGPTAFAERLSAARNTIYNDLKVLSEQGIIYKNGSGWKVNAGVQSTS